MKILVTGADGMLGSCLMNRLSGHHLHPLLERRCDITDAAAVAAAVARIAPDVIIHTAAYTDVEGCETNQEKTFQVNVAGTENLLRAAGGATFVYISSTGVYGNHKDEPYTENDPVRPTTAHHRSKHEAEKLVAAAGSRHIILRIGWLFGAAADHPRNFVVQRCLEAKGRDVIHSDDSQMGNPTYSENVAAQIRLLLEHRHHGIFNCVDRQPVSRHGYVREIVRLAGLPCRVEIAPPGYFNRVAPVSPNESALNRRLASLGIEVMEGWPDSLARYMESLELG